MTLKVKKWGNLLTLNPTKVGNNYDPENGECL